MRLPELTELPTQKDMTEEFLGYNHNVRNQVGEWYDEKNMTTDYYPIASPRNKRSRQDLNNVVKLNFNNESSYVTIGKKLGIAYTDDSLISLSTLNDGNHNVGAVFTRNGMIAGIQDRADGDYKSLTPIGINAVKQSDSVIRITFSHFNTVSDIVAGTDINFIIGKFDVHNTMKLINGTCEVVSHESHRVVLDWYVGDEAIEFYLEWLNSFERDGAGFRFEYRTITSSEIEKLIGKASYIDTSSNKTLTRMGSYIFTSPDGVVYETANKEADVPIFRVAEESNSGNGLVSIRSIIESNNDDSVFPYAFFEYQEPYRYSNKSVQYYINDSEIWVNQPTYVVLYTENLGVFDDFKVGDAIIIDSPYKPNDSIFSNKKAQRIISKGRFEAGNNYGDNDEQDFTVHFDNDADFIVVAGVFAKKEVDSETQEVSYRNFDVISNVTFTRKMPSILYACESQNRIWACSKDGHEIYASALGNPYNFYDYSGISTDSYAVNVGTDGLFTGCVNYMGQPLFFKENSLHIISGSYPTNEGQLDAGSYNVTTMTNFKGVEQGSERSLVVIDNILYYKSGCGFVAYDGANTVVISDALGKEKYKNAVAGSYCSKYYVCVEDSKSDHHVFVYDTKKGIWSKEDNANIFQFLSFENETVFLDADSGNVYSLSNEDILKFASYKIEDDVEWECETGTYGYSYPNNKYLSRYQIRMQLTDGARASVYIQYDSDGIWHNKGEMTGKGTRTFLFPIVPIRCDHMKLKIVGKGDAKIISIAKILEEGGDVQ